MGNVLHVPRCFQHWLVASLMFCITLPVTASEDNLLAHSLFKKGDFVRAAEIFTDPAWKGVALYRSGQWWRAAEAFVRAEDPVSAYNLGNCYVKLGYYELALDAYQQALMMDPSLDDAAYNAELMRQLLADEDSNSQTGGRQAASEEIERLDTQEDNAQSDGGGSGEEPAEPGDSAPTNSSDEQGRQSRASPEDPQAGRGAQATRQEASASQQGANGALRGQTSDEDPSILPSGGSESENPTDASQAAGLRASLETEQATTQWLNRINHDARLYLQRRIQLELRRRQASGQSAPEGGSSW